MPKSLADAKIRLDALTSKPTDPSKPTLAELTGAGVTPLMCHINKADYALGATGQDTVDEIEACKKGKGNAPGPASYDGSLTPFVYRDADGKISADEGAVLALLGDEGATLYLYEREGKPGTAEWAAGDTGDYYEVVLGVLKPPSDRFSGYEKRTVQLFVQDHQTFTVATA